MSSGPLSLAQIRAEVQRIIHQIMGDDLRAIPDDVPILDLGVSSLALVDGMRRVYDRFGVLVSIRRVIEGQITIGTLALYIEQELNAHQAQKKRAATEWKVERQIPLAPSQQHLGFLSRYSSEAGAAFNEALAVRIRGALHGPALHSALEEAGRRHEALRTSLDPEANALDLGTGEPLDLAVSSAEAGQVDSLLAEIASRPFEIGRRLFRAELLRLSESDHVLVLVGHALLLEQAALEIVLKDILDLYQRFAHDQDAGTPPPSLQWTDYLALGSTEEAKKARSRAVDLWRAIYSADVPRLELPADHPRPAVKRYAGFRVNRDLDAGLVHRLYDFAAVAGAAPETVLLAAWTIFLSRLSGSGDLDIGVESASLYLDGGLPAIANTRGMLPLRAQIDRVESFRAAVRRIQESLALANDHRHLSLSELIQLLQLQRDQSRSAMFTVAFRPARIPALVMPDGLECSRLVPPVSSARYDVELIARFHDEGLTLSCDASAELFEKETAARWLDGLAALLESALKDADQACGRLPMMNDRQRETLLVDWNATDRDYPRQKTVLDLIEERAHGDAIAVRFGASMLTYAQLLARTDQFAAALQRSGVQAGDRVGVLMKRSLDLIPALLGVWRAGALYVPLDPGYPKQRIATMLSDAGVQTILIHRDLLGLVDETSNVLCVEGVSAEGIARPVRGAEGAYIMYTSGSTGKPKGVQVRHAALLNCLLAVQEYLAFTPHCTMFALTTASFDISTNELFMPLISGGCVEVGEDGLVADGLLLAERLEKRMPSHAQLTASTWNMVLAAGWKGDPNICLVTTGEAIHRELAERLLAKCGALWNLYGPTETTVFSAVHRITSAPDEPMRIGRPLPNTSIYILDRDLQPVPIGAVGDLYIGGEGLAAGYWQRPDLTEQRFVPDPFRAGARMYATGDLARFLPDGDIVCLGRMDDQVKIHGVRVEPGEIESALRGLAGVRDAVVVSWKDTRGDSQLVAHVIPEQKDGLAAADLRARLRERLPEVMVPPFILFSDSFPKTANGKIQRGALPSPADAAQTAHPTLVEPPATVTEQAAAKIWAGLLNVDLKRIGRDSDFMDLGGHSLLMTLLVIEVRKRFQVNFNLREFFGASTLRKFSAMIDERRIDPGSGFKQSITQTAEWARQRMAFLQREAELPRWLAPARGLVYQPGAKIQHVLLTGATGFLGVYTLAEILNTTDAHIHCLIRPRRGEDSRARLEGRMKQYQVWRGGEAWDVAWSSRLHIVDGDVTLPRLGMSDPDYETLAREVDAIFHGAAHVNFIYPYEALRATNVLAIHEVIQFAFYARIKPVHHLSTAAIWPMGARYTYYETDPIDHVGRLNLGYDEAKWVGEKSMLHAEERGLPVARYRPGEVGGDSLTGRCVTDHFIIACFKGFLQFGAFPALDIEVDVAPVDYVARAMVHLAFRGDALGRAFHLTNPSRRRLSDGLDYLRGMGYRFEELPFEKLRDRLVASRSFSDNALFAYQSALDDMDDVSMQLPTYDTRETRRALAGSGISCPPADEKLFGTYLRYLLESGYLPQPSSL